MAEDSTIEEPVEQPAEDTTPQEAPKTEYSQSSGLGAWILNNKASIAFSSYQSGILYSLGLDPKNGGLHLHQAAIPRPMGITYHGEGRMTVISQNSILRFENVLTPEQRVNEMFDACFVPRRVLVTGALDAHDVGVDKDDEVVFVNTRFNCLAAPSMRHSFRPVWRPDFISDIIDEDRCHLNGLAMRDGAPAYVTALSKSNTIDGWRERRTNGGVVIEVASGKIVCEGLSMPHSPRWHNGELWLLNSGTGEVGVIAGLDKGKGKFEPRFFCPGFLRGLVLHNGYAIVGLSKPRYKRFEGLELDKRLKDADSEPWCGIQILDLTKGNCTEWFNIEGAVAELYDTELIYDSYTPMVIPPNAPELNNLITIAE